MKTPARGYAARQRRFRPGPALISAVVIVLAFGGLWIAGIIDPLRMLFGPKEPSTRGLIPVPVSAVAIPAYTKVVRDHMWNAQAGNFAVIYLSPNQVSSEMMRNMNSVIGRVLNHDKPANYVFTESDFMPKGTRPGLVAGIPAGKRAMRVLVEKIPGLVGLEPGDRFDLVSTLAIDSGGSAALATAGGLYAKQLDLQARLTNWQKQATVRVVVQNGSVVDPMRTRQVPVANNTLTSGLIVRTKPVQEVVIAVAPSEVARLTEALAVNAEISCVPRSGRPEDPEYSITPDSNPVSPYGGPVQRVYASPVTTGGTAQAAEIPTSTLPANPFGAGFTPIETISGSKREIVAAPVKR